jgi:hypothetical protein
MTLLLLFYIFHSLSFLQSVGGGAHQKSGNTYVHIEEENYENEIYDWNSSIILKNAIIKCNKSFLSANMEGM